MIELTELQSEQICGGRKDRNGVAGRDRGRGRVMGGGPGINTFRNTSLSSVLNVTPQINIAVNLAMFSSSIFNSQGNGSALVVA
jgi:hypothetical protein